MTRKNPDRFDQDFRLKRILTIFKLQFSYIYDCFGFNC